MRHARCFDGGDMRVAAALRNLPTTKILLALALALAASAVAVAVWG